MSLFVTKIALLLVLRSFAFPPEVRHFKHTLFDILLSLSRPAINRPPQTWTFSLTCHAPYADQLCTDRTMKRQLLEMLGALLLLSMVSVGSSQSTCLRQNDLVRCVLLCCSYSVDRVVMSLSTQLRDMLTNDGPRGFIP